LAKNCFQKTKFKKNGVSMSRKQVEDLWQNEWYI